MIRMRPFLPAILASLAAMMIINGGTFFSGLRHGIGIAEMGTSSDAAYYFALIRDAATGHMNLGHASLKEHADDFGSSTYAPLPQGLLMRVTGLRLSEVVYLWGLLCSFLATFLLCMIFRPLVRDDRLAALLGFSVFAWTVGLAILRPLSPQITLTLLLASVALIVRGHGGRDRPWRGGTEWWRFALRGLAIALLLYAQIVWAAYLLLVEACDFFVRRGWKTGWKLEIKSLAWFALPLGIAVAIKLILSGLTSDPVAAEDMIHRLGLISSHYPAAPKLQLELVLTILVALVVRYRFGAAACSRMNVLLVLLVAGVLALNQSVVHGKDAIFGLYYAQPLKVILWIAWLTMLFTILPSKAWRFGAAGALAAYMLFTLSHQAVEQYRLQESERVTIGESGVPSVLAWLRIQPQDSVVLAPYPVADLVPVFTDDYVLFNRYARYQTARDSELAERYLLQEAFFPTPADKKDDTYNLVFGLYAGNASARQRTACRIKAKLAGADAACDFTIRDAIIHQDVLKTLDENKPDVAALLRKFHVDFIVMPLSKEFPLPEEAQALCQEVANVGPGYVIYACQEK
jgi:hypothetical protein